MNELKPALLLNQEIWDFDELINEINHKTYTSLDSNVPVCRYRGTAIIKLSDEYKIVAWERNISLIQKMEASLPTIITLRLDNQKRIKEIDLDSKFVGSRGILCYYPYLNKNIKEKLIGIAMEPASVKALQIEKMYCFHISEVLLGVISCLQLMDEHGLQRLFEEEILDGVRQENSILFSGLQKFSFMDKPSSYQIEVNNVMNSVRFDSEGNIFTDGVMDATCYVDNKELLKCEINGTSEKKIYVKLKKVCSKILEVVRNQYTTDENNYFLCSILTPQAFIGVFIQAAAIKLFSNNYTYILHCLSGIQRHVNTPKCLGSLKSQKEADIFSPGFSIAEALRTSW